MKITVDHIADHITQCQNMEISMIVKYDCKFVAKMQRSSDIVKHLSASPVQRW